MKRVYVASPLRGDIAANTQRAKRLCRAVIEAGHAPFASHLLYPLFLDEHSAEERRLGSEAGIAFLHACDEVWVAPGPVTEGMAREIEHAKNWRIPVKHDLWEWRDL